VEEDADALSAGKPLGAPTVSTTPSDSAGGFI